MAYPHCLAAVWRNLKTADGRTIVTGSLPLVETVVN